MALTPRDDQPAGRLEGPAQVVSLVREGDKLQDQGRIVEAIAAYEQALALNPDCQAAWYSLGCAWMRRGEDARAAECLQRSQALAPEHRETNHNLGKCLFELGLIDEAVSCFQRALAHGGRFLPKTALATVIPGCPGADNRIVLEVRRRWAQDHLPPPDFKKAFPREPIAGRRIRIGYLSSFFGSRNWMKPVWGLVNAHDRSRFDIHLFSDGAREECGACYRDHPDDRFHNIAALTNRQAADQIEAQRLDVLIDLNGYSSVEWLAVIALQPAPVIAGWFNLYATTGMAHYHYLIGDSHVIPAVEEQHYVEKILRVPGSCLTFEAGYPVPPVAGPPVARSGRFTFGSLASLHKITPAVVDAWAAILHRAPGACLFLKNSKFGAVSNREHTGRRFAEQGIEPHRLQMEGPSEHYEFLTAYDRIDAALDSFPYNGGTTTTEAIWQGVPVLTFYGDRWASRTSATILREAGLGEFVAGDADRFVARAAALANDPETPRRLTELRRTMRERLRHSSVCDTAAFARRMENVYEQIAHPEGFRGLADDELRRVSGLPRVT